MCARLGGAGPPVRRWVCRGSQGATRSRKCAEAWGLHDPAVEHAHSHACWATVRISSSFVRLCRARCIRPSRTGAAACTQPRACSAGHLGGHGRRGSAQPLRYVHTVAAAAIGAGASWAAARAGRAQHVEAEPASLLMHIGRHPMLLHRSRCRLGGAGRLPGARSRPGGRPRWPAGLCRVSHSDGECPAQLGAACAVELFCLHLQLCGSQVHLPARPYSSACPVGPGTGGAGVCCRQEGSAHAAAQPRRTQRHGPGLGWVKGQLVPCCHPTDQMLCQRGLKRDVLPRFLPSLSPACRGTGRLLHCRRLVPPGIAPAAGATRWRRQRAAAQQHGGQEHVAADRWVV